MITFLEGLPRSGKSYTAMKDEIIPALQAGRAVYAYLEGLDHAKIAEVAEIPEEQCRALLHPITREDVKRVYAIVANDSLVILDEAQNFWPNSRGRLDEPTTQFIAEHGHRGLDIILMGQVLKDVHSLWRGRVERKIYFLKKSALGKPNAYSATFYTAIPKGDKVDFEKVQTIDYEYEEKYFGTYKSHTDGTANKGTKVDARAVIWNRPIFRKWLPLYVVVFFGSAYYLWYLMHGGLAPSSQTPAATNSAPKVVNPPSAPLHADSGTAIRPGVTDGVLPESTKDTVQDLSEKNRVRLIGSWQVTGLARNGMIEWRDAAGNLIQAMSFRDIEGFGYTVFVNTTATVAVMQRGPARIVATSWAIDKREGVASERQQQSVRGAPSSESKPSAVSTSPFSEKPVFISSTPVENKSPD